jgi:hypothetical protein
MGAQSSKELEMKVARLTDDMKQLRKEVAKSTKDGTKASKKYQKAQENPKKASVETEFRQLKQAYKNLYMFMEALTKKNDSLSRALEESLYNKDNTSVSQRKKEINDAIDSMKYYQKIAKEAVEQQAKYSEANAQLLKELEIERARVIDLTDALDLHTSICIKDFKIMRYQKNALTLRLNIDAAPTQLDDVNLDIEIYKQESNRSAHLLIAAKTVTEPLRTNFNVTFEPLNGAVFDQNNTLNINRSNYFVKISYKYKDKQGTPLTIIINDIKNNDINIINYCSPP